ncbi:MAG: hypothetical protein HC808_10245 [Candidatus Competibacteraceae bacterium]|nr:hypothetical protein [Candidatus Competibacteraceae bacterium]
MIRGIRKYLLLFSLAIAGWICNGEIGLNPQGGLIATAEAVIGRPATPVSYAGVARRTTRRAVTPGVGAPGYGVRPGVGVNLGGPVNRVGVR